MTDDLVKRMRDIPDPDTHAAADRIEALTAQLAEDADARTQIGHRLEQLAAQVDALTAENEVYRAALNEIETAPEPDRWVPQYQHCVGTAELAIAEAISARAALTGKEVPSSDAPATDLANQIIDEFIAEADIGPGDQAVAGAAKDAALYGTGFMLDGEHVPHEDVYAQPEQVAGAAPATVQAQIDAAVNAERERWITSLAPIRHQAASTRGEQAYRELPSFVVNVLTALIRKGDQP